MNKTCIMCFKESETPVARQCSACTKSSDFVKHNIQSFKAVDEHCLSQGTFLS